MEEEDRQAHLASEKTEEARLALEDVVVVVLTAVLLPLALMVLGLALVAKETEELAAALPVLMVLTLVQGAMALLAAEGVEAQLTPPAEWAVAAAVRISGHKQATAARQVLAEEEALV